MNAVRRSATSRLEAGEATWLAWTSATEQEIDEALINEPAQEGTNIETHRRSLVSQPEADRLDVALTCPDSLLEARRQVDEFYAGGPPPSTESQSNRLIVNGHGNSIEALDPHHPQYARDVADHKTNDFEPVEDLPSLPRLDFKPIILRKWTLISIATFYVGVIVGLAILYHYENKARIFHIRATASRFTVRILPSLIGTLSMLIFQSVVSNFGRILPFIIMAEPTKPGSRCAIARQTLLAPYFPLFNIFASVHNNHFRLSAMMFIQQFLYPFKIPTKSTLISRKASEKDPGLWNISISGPSPRYLIFNYALMYLIMLGLIAYLWNRRTGLRWDPVSIAVCMMLLQDLDILQDFSGLEYKHPSYVENFSRIKQQFYRLMAKKYRLGYWRHTRTNQYWHGMRSWSALYDCISVPHDITTGAQEAQIITADPPRTPVDSPSRPLSEPSTTVDSSRNIDTRLQIQAQMYSDTSSTSSLTDSSRECFFNAIS